MSETTTDDNDGEDGRDPEDIFADKALEAIRGDETEFVIEGRGEDWTFWIGAVNLSSVGDEWVYPKLFRGTSVSTTLASEYVVRQEIRKNWPEVDIIPYDRSGFA